MSFQRYVERVRHEPLVAAATGTNSLRRTGNILAAGLEPALRVRIVAASTGAPTDVTQAASDVMTEIRRHGRRITRG